VIGKRRCITTYDPLQVSITENTLRMANQMPRETQGHKIGDDEYASAFNALKAPILDGSLVVK
jgi:hypothetical protein